MIIKMFEWVLRFSWLGWGCLLGYMIYNEHDPEFKTLFSAWEGATIVTIGFLFQASIQSMGISTLLCITMVFPVLWYIKDPGSLYYAAGVSLLTLLSLGYWIWRYSLPRKKVVFNDVEYGCPIAKNHPAVEIVAKSMFSVYCKGVIDGRQGDWAGSAIYIGEGFAVTNAHVAQNADTMCVINSNHDVAVSAQRVGLDLFHDLALIR